MVLSYSIPLAVIALNKFALQFNSYTTSLGIAALLIANKFEDTCEYVTYWTEVQQHENGRKGDRECCHYIYSNFEYFIKQHLAQPELLSKPFQTVLKYFFQNI